MKETERLTSSIIAREISRNELRFTPLRPIVLVPNLETLHAIASSSNNRVMSAHAVISTEAMNSARFRNGLVYHLPNLMLLAETIDTQVPIRVKLEHSVYSAFEICGNELEPIRGKEAANRIENSNFGDVVGGSSGVDGQSPRLRPVHAGEGWTSEEQSQSVVVVEVEFVETRGEIGGTS